MHRRTLLASAVGCVALTAGCLGEDDDDEPAANDDLPDDVTVEVSNDGFDPLIVHIAAGGSVTWENTTDEETQIDSHQFETASTGWSYGESIEPGESITHTFDDDGLFDYTNFALGSEYNTCGRVRVGTADEGGSLPCE